MTINGKKIVKLTVGRVTAKYDKDGHLASQKFGVIAFDDKGQSAPVAEIVAEDCADAEERKRLNALMKLGTRAGAIVACAQIAQADKSVKLSATVTDNLTEAEASVEGEKAAKAKRAAQIKAEKATGEYQFKQIQKAARIPCKDEAAKSILGRIDNQANAALLALSGELDKALGLVKAPAQKAA